MLVVFRLAGLGLGSPWKLFGHDRASLEIIFVEMCSPWGSRPWLSGLGLGLGIGLGLARVAARICIRFALDLH